MSDSGTGEDDILPEELDDDPERDIVACDDSEDGLDTWPEMENFLEFSNSGWGDFEPDEEARSFLLHGLLYILAATGVVIAVAIFVGGHAWKDTYEALPIWLPTIVALLGSSVAFYFSGHHNPPKGPRGRRRRL